MKHYVVLLEWSIEGDNGLNILGIVNSPEEAKEIFKETADEERKLVEEIGWEIYEDTDVEFDAGEDGDCCPNHSRLYIQEVI